MASYYHQYNDRGDHVNRVEIIDSAQSTPTLINTSTGNPIHLRHGGDKNERKVIKGKELQFSFFCFPEDVNKYDELFESDYKDYKVRFYEDSQLKFEGWLTPENLSREFFRDKYIINLSATDGLAKLKNVEFLDANNSIIEGKLSLLEIIKHALAKLELELDFRVQLGTYESALMTSSQCALKEMNVETRRFVIGNKPMFCSQVIEACLKLFSCTLKQQDGYYQITNKHEGNSYQFIFDWSSLTQQSRTATSKIVDLSGYFYESAELNKISPLREFGIIFRNRDLGEDATGADLTDWANDWTISFDQYWIDNGVVQLYSGVNYPGDYIEPKNDFNVPYVFPFNSTDYFTITFDYFIETITPTKPNPVLLISVKRPGGEYSDPLFIYLQLDKWVHFDSAVHPRLKVLSAGDHNIRFTFDHDEDTDPGNFYFFLKNVNISVISSPGGDPDIDTEVSQDEYYKQTTGKNLELLEEESQFADGNQVTETGALLHNGTTLTTSWNSYGNSEGIKILDIWARNELNDRYSYKNYLKIICHDIESNIDIDKILSIGGKYYTFVSYQRNYKKCIVTGDLEELLLTHQSYNAINSYPLESSEGDSTSSSSAGISSIGVHNYLIGLEGGAESEYYHLSAAEHTELHAWLDNVILSDAGGIDMDDVLKVNTIQEHTADNGIDAESVHLEDGGITLGTGPAVDTIETTLTDDDTHLPTSGAVYDAIIAASTYWERTGTTLSPVNSGDDVQIDGGTLTVNTIGEYGAGVGVTIDTGLLKDASLGDASHYWNNAYLSLLLYFKNAGGTNASFIFAEAADHLHFRVGSGESYFDTLGIANDIHIYDNSGTPHWMVIDGAGFVTTADDMIFEDGTTGPHTLSDLIAGGGMVYPGAGIALSTGSAWSTSITDNSADWNTAYGWGDHTGLYADLSHASTHESGGGDQVDHDSLTGFVANEHINHISVSIGAGTGLSGGGDITATRTIDLDLSDCTAITTLSDPDEFGVYDSGVGQRKITYANIKTELNGDLNFCEPGGAYHDGFSDFVSAEHVNHSTLDIITGTTSGLSGGAALTSDVTLLLALNRLTAITTLQTIDYFGVYDASAAGTRRISYSYLITELNGDLNFCEPGGAYHDGFSDFVANEHINHTSISINTQYSLTGGGTIAATRTLNLVGDTASPGNSKYYGTNAGGTRGWYDLTGGIDMTNGANNRVCTAVDSDTINGEANLTFDGSILDVSGDIDCNRFNTESYGLKMIGSNTGDTNTSYIGFYESNGTTRQGYIGLASSGNDDLYVKAESGTLLLQSSSEAVEIYHAGSKKLETTSVGISITGNLGIGVAPDATYDLKVQGDSYFVGSIGINGPISTDSYLKAYNNTIEKYAGSFFHDGNSVNRYGLKIQCGEDDQSGGGTQAMYIRFFDGDGQSEGNIVVDAGTLQFAQGSDARRKTNIQNVYLNIPKILSEIPVKEFDMLSKKGEAVGHQIGWVSQEVKKIYKPMVFYDKDTDLCGIKPGVIVPLLHRGWQLHEKTLETQQQKINRLERHIITLETKLKNHETKIKRLG